MERVGERRRGEDEIDEITPGEPRVKIEQRGATLKIEDDADA